MKSFLILFIVTFEVREEAVGIGQVDSVAKYGIGESIGQTGDVLEDDYGISVRPESFVDIVTGVDPSKYSSGSGRVGDDVLKRGLGFGADGRPLLASSGNSLSNAVGEVRAFKLKLCGEVLLYFNSKFSSCSIERSKLTVLRMKNWFLKL